MENILLSSKFPGLVLLDASSYHSHVVRVKGLIFAIIPDIEKAPGSHPPILSAKLNAH